MNNDRRVVRPKPITTEEFEPIKQRDWRPVELDYSVLPEWMKKIPVEQRLRVFASGSSIGNFNINLGGEHVGGILVFRDATDHEEPYDWNKDKYLIIRDLHNDNALLMQGIYLDDEHWTNVIPDRLQNVEVLKYEKEGDE